MARQHLLVGPVIEVQQATNELLAAGWRVVPGTALLVSLERLARGGELMTPRGTAYDARLVVVLEQGE